MEPGTKPKVKATEQVDPVAESKPAEQAAPKDERQLEAERLSEQNRRYYRNYPRIMGGVCEFCGGPAGSYRMCPHYRDVCRSGDPICMCGKSREPGAMRSIQVMYIPHRNAWICDTLGCENRYKQLYHGLEPRTLYHFNKSHVLMNMTGEVQLLPEVD